MRLLSFFAMFIAWAAFADAERVFVGYSSQGPDRYADGSIVQDGECYALVCSKAGTAFGGFNMDGTLANPQNDDLAAVAPSAKDGCCQRVAFMLFKDYQDKHPKGKWTWCVYLVDTRCATGRPAGLKDGVLARANSYSRPDANIFFRSGPTLQSLAAPTEAVPDNGLCTSMPAKKGDTPNPVITGVTVKDGKLQVQVENTVGWVTYDLAGGQKLDAPKASVADSLQDGNATRPIVLTTTANEKAKFVRVVNHAGMPALPKEDVK